jgi:hypothetical protein
MLDRKKEDDLYLFFVSVYNIKLVFDSKYLYNIAAHQMIELFNLLHMRFTHFDTQIGHPHTSPHPPI